MKIAAAVMFAFILGMAVEDLGGYMMTGLWPAQIIARCTDR